MKNPSALGPSDGAPSFRPFPFLGRPHLQTLLGAQLKFGREPPSERRLLPLPGGDRIVLEVSTPPSFSPQRLTVVMIHGLCGSGQSGYLVRLARKLHARGLRAVRVNLRGAGAGRGLARQPYHSGRSEDVLEVLRSLERESPASPRALLGFSLGGNITLKLAGELGAEAGGLLEQVIAVSPPVDLLATSRKISSRSNRIYERYFLRLLRRDAALRLASFPELPVVDLPDPLSLFEFDERYTARLCGFEGALDYYRKASSLPLLSRIAIPCRILVSDDDPLIDCSALEGLELPPKVEVVRTARGGHLGFLGFPGSPGGFRWMDSRLLEWLSRPGAPGA